MINKMLLATSPKNKLNSKDKILKEVFKVKVEIRITSYIKHYQILMPPPSTILPHLT
jgi:hypothetical protein